MQFSKNITVSWGEIFFSVLVCWAIMKLQAATFSPDFWATTTMMIIMWHWILHDRKTREKKQMCVDWTSRHNEFCFSGWTQKKSQVLSLPCWCINKKFNSSHAKRARIKLSYHEFFKSVTSSQLKRITEFEENGKQICLVKHKPPSDWQAKRFFAFWLRILDFIFHLILQGTLRKKLLNFDLA